MSLLEWAEREIALAIKNERGDAPEDEWDYGVACYESALKAFKSLLEDGHSGASIRYTKHILNRLIDGQCLLPIEDTEDVWKLSREEDDYTVYQCIRMSSLFKDVYKDGRVVYNDLYRYYCEDVNSGVTFTSGIVSRLIDETYPITMPYMPSSKKYKVVTEDFATTGEVGCWDTFAIHYIITPEGDKVKINKFYKEDSTGELVEITEEEYFDRRIKYINNASDETINCEYR